MSSSPKTIDRSLVITITNQKGGTGKTTLAALLAYGLALKGYNVLMLDLDPQAHLSSLFLKTEEVKNIADGTIQLAMDSIFRIRKIELSKSTPGKIGLVPSGLNYMIKVFKGEIPTYDPHSVLKRIRKEPAIREYNFIICDTGPELFAPTLWGLYAADHLIIPSNLEELSLAGVELFLREVFPAILEERGPRILGVALVNVTGRVSKKTFENVAKRIHKIIDSLPSSIRAYIYSRPLFNTIIHRYRELKDLIYRPRRRRMPLVRVIERRSRIKSEVESFVSEVLDKASSFKSTAEEEGITAWLKSSRK